MRSDPTLNCPSFAYGCQSGLKPRAESRISRDLGERGIYTQPMATKDELHTLAMSLFNNAKDDLARDGSVKSTHILLTRDGHKVWVNGHAGVDKDAMARTLKAVAPACKRRWDLPSRPGWHRSMWVSAPRRTPTA